MSDGQGAPSPEPSRGEVLRALAERVEALTGPDRNIDTEILWHVDRRRFTVGYWNAASGIPRELVAMPSPKGGLGWIGAQCSAPVYTASLDAAMTLVPEGWRIYAADFSVKGRTRWMLEGPKLQRIPQDDGTWEGGEDWYRSGVGATPALALTAACLKALATDGQQ